jgi:hypothetical protein
MSANADPVITQPTTDTLPAPRRRGRPLEMSPDEVLGHIRQLAARGEMFRVHLGHPALYARARRQFGSWAEAVARAGADYAVVVEAARRRAVDTRRSRRSRRRFR